MLKQLGWKCTECGEEIYSNSRHDWVSCQCGNIYVDGGFDYFRAGWYKSPGIQIEREVENPPFYFRDEQKLSKETLEEKVLREFG